MKPEDKALLDAVKRERDKPITAKELEVLEKLRSARLKLKGAPR